jgi:hypothetical protein
MLTSEEEQVIRDITKIINDAKGMTMGRVFYLKEQLRAIAKKADNEKRS